MKQTSSEKRETYENDFCYLDSLREFPIMYSRFLKAKTKQPASVQGRISLQKIDSRNSILQRKLKLLH